MVPTGKIVNGHDILLILVNLLLLGWHIRAVPINILIKWAQHTTNDNST